MEKIYSEAVSHYGDVHQILKAIEEMSELQKELCKFLGAVQDGTYINHPELHNRARTMITEEMADVYVMLRQLKLIFNNEETVETVISGKLARLRGRMDRDGT